MGLCSLESLGAGIRVSDGSFEGVEKIDTDIASSSRKVVIFSYVGVGHLEVINAQRYRFH